MLICNISSQKVLMDNSFWNNLYTYQKYMSQIPYLKTEDARDCTKGAQVSMFSFSSPKWKPKLITNKLFLIYKLIPQT